jgi:serine/threonine-protein kinase
MDPVSARAKTLFLQACELPTEEREGFLADACGGDVELVDRVRSLLVASERADGVEAMAEDLADAAEPDPRPRLVAELASRYEVLEEAGVGGMARVYRARDLKHDRSVALKVLRPEVAAVIGSPRFLREIRVAAGLQHPGILPLYDSGEAGDLLYYVMPFVEGHTLRGRIEEVGQLTVEEVLAVTRDVAAALDHAHAAGLVHRDVKPDNVLLLEGRAVLADFGLAAGASEAGEERLTQPGTVIGTPSYMSPEQAFGRVDKRSDLYSLGCMVYEMLAGEPPFTGKTMQMVLARHLSDPVPPIRTVRPQVPVGMEAALMRALAKQPADRFESAGEMVEALSSTRASIGGKQWTLVLAIAATLLFVMAWAFSGRGKEPRLTSASLVGRAITGTGRWETTPHWSPGSDSIVFGAMTEGGVDLFVQSTAGGPPTLRLALPGDEVSPRWSPDGKTIAFVSSGRGSPIYVAPAHGGDPRKLIETGIAALDIDSMQMSLGDRAWLPDGERILVSLTVPTGQLAIHRVDVGDGSTTQLSFPHVGTDDFSASLSFDGERIVFMRREHGRGSLWSMPADGGEPELLYDESDCGEATWRNDSRHVVFQTDRGEGFANLWELDTRTRELLPLTSETRWIYGFSVSNDDRIAYTPFWHDTFLYVIDAESGVTRRITDHVADNFGARWSPDGRTVAYHSTRTVACDVFLHHLDGGPETNLTDSPHWDAFPDWSPDGETLLFASNRDGDGKIKMFLVNRDGGNVRRLLDQPLSLRAPSPANASLVARWSPDGHEIAYLTAGDGGTSLWTVAADGTGARARLDGVKSFDWYVDERRGVISCIRDGEEQLLAVDLETGAEVLLYTGAHAEVDVAPDGSSVAFSAGPGHLGMGLHTLALERPASPGGLPAASGEPVAHEPPDRNWHVHFAGWSPDSKSLVYTRDEDYGDVFELVERR